MKIKWKALNDPLRQRVLAQLGAGGELSAKELAARVRVSPNGLYYHLKLLEQAGFVEVAGSRVSGRTAERTYRTGPSDVHNQKMDWDLSEPLTIVMAFQTMLDLAKVGVEEGVYEMAQLHEARTPSNRWLGVVEAPAFSTHPDEIAAFTKRFRELIAEFRQRAKAMVPDGGEVPEDWRRFHLTYAMWDHAVEATA